MSRIFKTQQNKVENSFPHTICQKTWLRFYSNFTNQLSGLNTGEIVEIYIDIKYIL